MTSQIAEKIIAPAVNIDLKKSLLAHLSRNISGDMSKWIYSDPIANNDPVNGAYWWEKASQNPSYTMFTRENSVLQNIAPELELVFRLFPIFYDMGPGPSEAVKRKTLPLAKYWPEKMVYAPIDYCQSYLNQAIETVKIGQSKIIAAPIAADYDAYVPSKKVPAFVFYPSGSFLNFAGDIDEPFPFDTLVERFKALRRLTQNGVLLLSYDAEQNADKNHAVYSGEDFQKLHENLAYRWARDINITGDFDPSVWHYKPVWNEKSYRYAHRLMCEKNQTFMIDGQSYTYNKGDGIVINNSYKIPKSVMTKAAQQAGFSTIRAFEKDGFIVHLFKDNQAVNQWTPFSPAND